MTVSCAELAANLAEAQAALHKRLIGKAVEQIRAGEKGLNFSTISVPDLRDYVKSLQRQVDGCNGVRRNGRAIPFMPVDC